jgi:hypothetical protein
MHLTAIQVWWTLEAAFIFLCIVGAAMFVLWLVAAVIFAWGCRPKRGDHRVGGVLKP